MKKSKKITLIIEIVILAVVVLFAVVSSIIQLAAPDLGYSVWLKNNVWDLQAIGATLNTHLPTVIKCVIIIVVVFALCKLVRLCLHKQMKRSNRVKTIFTLADGFVKYGCAIVVIIFGLKALGVNTTAIFASVGILTLIVGLGAQSLIADVIAGMFIIFENEYNVGEIVTIGDFRGTVIEIGVRSTKLLDLAGNIKIINNSAIGNVVNMSRELSLAVVDCEFPYDVPLEFIENLLKDNFEEMKANIPAIQEGPFYKGVSYYAASNVAVKVVAKCSEEDRYQVQRDIMREYRKLINAHGIDLSFEQVVINQPSPTVIKMTEEEKETAAQFVNEQKEASKGMDDQEA